MRRSATRALAVLSLLFVLIPSPSLSISSQTQAEQQLLSTSHLHLNAERSAPDSPQMTRNRRAWLALKTIERPPVSIVDVLRNEQAAGLPKLFDPLVDVALLGNAPENDAIVKEVKKQLSEVSKPQTGVKWLDSANEDDRTLLGSIFAYCTTLYAARGVERDCVVQCHPKVDCGAQGARLCQKFRTDDADLWASKNYKMYVTCADRERQFCEKNGAFENEKYPYFRFLGDNEDQKARDIEQYCANIFQMRGLKMPCLLDCTITTWRMRDPDKYQKWKSKSHLREFRGKKDPSEVMFNDPQYMSYYECEKNALKLCRFLRPDYFRECYERVKFKCMFNIDNWNTLLDD